MITYLKIDGFKSFCDFEMNFTPFTVIAGANASGKTNLFDALRLLSDLADGNINHAFTNQRGEAKELFTQYGANSFAARMDFEVDMLVDREVSDRWGGHEVLKYTRMKYRLAIERYADDHGIDQLRVIEEFLDKIPPGEDVWMKQNVPGNFQYNYRPKVIGGRAKPYIHTKLRNGEPTIFMPQDGGKGGGKASRASAVEATALSKVQEVNFPHAFAAREEIRNWRFLELNPENLRAPTKKEIGFSDRITQSGKNIAAALYRISRTDPDALEDISRRMFLFFNQLPRVEIVDDSTNNQFVISITTNDGKAYTSRVLSEGTLRLLTLLVYLFDPEHRTLLCYEEPENGIHPGRLSELVRLLKDLTVDLSEPQQSLRQLIINTHSPGLTGEALNLARNHSSVSVWLASMARRPMKFPDGQKTVLHHTIIKPVIDEAQTTMSLFPDIEISESVRRYTREQMRQYLEAPANAPAPTF